MKKLAIFLAILLVFCVPLEVTAASRIIQAKPKLTFSGTTATCTVTILADKTTDHLEVTMWLMDGTTCVASWHSAGDGYVIMNKTATVTAGRTYKLVVEVFESGKTHDPVYVTGTC